MSETTTETGTPPEGTPAENGNAEAAKMRHRAKAAEAERDGLRTRVESFQRAEVERLAGEHVKKPDALWAGGVELESLLGDDGNVDPAKVRTAALDAADRLGLERPRPALAVPGEGGNPRTTGGKSFEDAFKL